MRGLLCARVSTQEQAEQNLSIPDQLRQLQAYCQKHQHEVVKDVLRSRGLGHGRQQASIPGDDRVRPRSLEPDRGHPRVGLIPFLPRLLWCAVLQAQAQAGVRVISITQETSDDPMGQFVEGVFELQDEYESRINGYHTLRGMKENARQGDFNGSTPPFGYRVETVEDGSEKPKRRLVPDEVEAETVRLIFRLYVDGVCRPS